MLKPTSPRLTYRMLTKDDAELLFDLDNDPKVMQYINGGSPSTHDDIEKVMIPRFYKYKDEHKGFGLWGVFTQADNAFIGWILVRPMGFFQGKVDESDLELGWRFKASSWGKGFGFESAHAIVNALKTNPNYQYFSAIAVPENQGSINIMKKLGLTYVKTELHKDPLGDIEAVFYRGCASDVGTVNPYLA